MSSAQPFQVGEVNPRLCRQREEVAVLGGEEVEELSCFPPPAAGGWAVIPARGQCPQEQESSWLSSGMAPIRCGWHHPALTHTLKPPSWTLPRSGVSWDVGTVGRSQHSPARAAGLSWRVPALGCAFRCCGQVLALCIPQEPQGTAPQSSQCWTRSSDRTFVSLELLDSGQKQRSVGEVRCGGSPRTGHS